MRVVAWHNAHPLARRITATQVHSIGEVVLPFASRQPGPVAGPAAPTPPAAPALDDLLDPAQQPSASLLPTTPDPQPAGQASDATALAAADEAFSEDSFETVGDHADAQDTDGADAEMAAAMAEAAGLPAAGLPAAELPAAQPAPASIAQAGPAPAAEPGQGGPAEAPRPAGNAALAAAAARHAAADRPAIAHDQPALLAGWRRHLQALGQRLGLRPPAWPRLRATFSNDFIWPLRPGTVARWARRHGALRALAPDDWPRRVVDTDPLLQAAARQKGLPHAVSLHLLTAAIGVGDRRIRVLMDADGAVIGPRAYSRERVASASLAVMLILGGGWGLLRPDAQDPAQALAGEPAGEPAGAHAGKPAREPAHEPGQAAAQSALAASASEDAAAGTDPAAALAAGSAATAAAAAAATAAAADDRAAGAGAGPHDPASPAGPAATAAHDASADETDRSLAARPGTAPHRVAQPAAGELSAAAEAHTATADTRPAPGVDAPSPPTPATPLGRVRPPLSVDEKADARAQANALRAPPAGAPIGPTGPQPVYAVVSRPTRERYAAAANLALMRASSMRLPPPLPAHNELMQNQGVWRAAWWPFTSLADAERARVMLAARGLKVEVVEL